jgi:hypothetical protein
MGPIYVYANKFTLQLLCCNQSSPLVWSTYTPLQSDSHLLAAGCQVSPGVLVSRRPEGHSYGHLQGACLWRILLLLYCLVHQLLLPGPERFRPLSSRLHTAAHDPKLANRQLCCLGVAMGMMQHPNKASAHASVKHCSETLQDAGMQSAA